MIMAFLLTVYIDGASHESSGIAVFRDIYRCEEFGDAIERSANSIRAGGRYFYENKVQTLCLPKYVPEDTRFWD